MQAVNNKNKGMFLEEIINKTCDYYFNNNIAIIYKRFLPIKPLKIVGNNVNGILLNKSTVDYNGIYKGYYLDFEAKQTQSNYFLISNIKKHQLDHLKAVYNHGAISFVIINFFVDDKFFAISYEQIDNLINNKMKKLSLEYCLNNFFEIKLIFPGILDLKSFFDYLIANRNM